MVLIHKVADYPTLTNYAENTSTDLVNFPSVIIQAISSIRSSSTFKPAWPWKSRRRFSCHHILEKLIIEIIN